MNLDDCATEIGRLYAAGHTQAEIAQAYGVSQTHIWRLMTRHGITTRACRQRSGSASRNWKGDDAGYGALHERVRKLRGSPRRCEQCGTTSRSVIFEWANLTGNYADVNDYARMCRPCHRSYDYARQRGPASLSLTKAAERIGIAKTTLRKYIGRGLIAAQKAGSSRFSPYRITEEAIAEYLKRQTAEATR